MKQRIKKFLKWAAIASGLLLTVVFLWSAYYTWSTGRRLEASLLQLRIAGDPLSIADFAAQPIPPEANADIPFQRVAGDLEAFQKEMMTLFPDTGRAVAPLTPDVQEKLDALFREYPRLIPNLLDASQRPDYAHDYDVSRPSQQFLEELFKSISEKRAAGRILQSWSTLQAAQGRRDEALAADLATLRLARHWSRDPTMNAYLVSIAVARTGMLGAVEVLRAGPVSEESRKTLDAELALHDDQEGVRRTLKNERAFSLTAIREMSGPVFWLRGGMRNSLTLLLLDFYDDQLRNVDLPFSQIRYAAAAGPSSAQRSRHPLKLLVTLLEPAMASLREAFERQRAVIRSLRVLNALQAISADDATTPDLATLGLPPEATQDPFTNNRPLIVKRRPNGWLVYSVGLDGKDDGGDLKKDTDVGFDSDPPTP